MAPAPANDTKAARAGAELLLRSALQTDGSSSQAEISFEYRKHHFIYNSEQHSFEKLKYPVKVGTGLSAAAVQLAHQERGPQGLPRMTSENLPRMTTLMLQLFSRCSQGT